MKYEELIEGSIYYCKWPNKYLYIMRRMAGEAPCPYIELTEKTSSSYGYFHTTTCEYRVATEEEQAHFLQCERAGKYVEYTPIEYIPLIFN